jgi:hypothetical protein
MVTAKQKAKAEMKNGDSWKGTRLEEFMMEMMEKPRDPSMPALKKCSIVSQFLTL